MAGKLSVSKAVVDIAATAATFKGGVNFCSAARLFVTSYLA